MNILTDVLIAFLLFGWVGLYVYGEMAHDHLGGDVYGWTRRLNGWIDRLLFKMVCRRIVAQPRLSQFFGVLREELANTYTEDNLVTIDLYMKEAIDGAKQYFTDDNVWPSKV